MLPIWIATYLMVVGPGGSRATPSPHPPGSQAIRAFVAWAAPESCPSAAEVAKRVMVLTGGRVPPSDSQVAFEVRRNEQSEWVLEMRTQMQSRTIIGADCEELAEAAALMLALTVERVVPAEQPEGSDQQSGEREAPTRRPRASRPGADDPVSQTRVSPPDRPGGPRTQVNDVRLESVTGVSTDGAASSEHGDAGVRPRTVASPDAGEIQRERSHRVKRTARTRRPRGRRMRRTSRRRGDRSGRTALPRLHEPPFQRLALTAQLSGTWRVIPGLWPGATVGLGVRGPRWSLDGRLTSIPWARVTSTSGVYQASFALVAAEFRVCYSLANRRVELPLCAGVDGGTIHGRGLGPLSGPTTATSPWLALVGGARVRVPANKVVWTIELDGLFMPMRAQFVIREVGSPCCAARAALRLAVGAEFRWPTGRLRGRRSMPAKRSLRAAGARP